MPTPAQCTVQRLLSVCCHWHPHAVAASAGLRRRVAGAHARVRRARGARARGDVRVAAGAARGGRQWRGRGRVCWLGRGGRGEQRDRRDGARDGCRRGRGWRGGRGGARGGLKGGRWRTVRGTASAACPVLPACTPTSWYKTKRHAPAPSPVIPVRAPPVPRPRPDCARALQLQLPTVLVRAFFNLYGPLKQCLFPRPLPTP